MLAVVGVAAIALGTGFLNNDINLWIQQFGVGSGDISTPTDHVVVDFNIMRTETTPIQNVIDKCILTPDDTVGLPIGTSVNSQTTPSGTHDITKDSEITCKLTNAAGQIIAEGTVGTPINNDDPNDPDCPIPAPTETCDQVGGVFQAGVGIMVPVTPVPNVFDVHDVIVVVHANTYSEGDSPPVAPEAP